MFEVSFSQQSFTRQEKNEKKSNAGKNFVGILYFGVKKKRIIKSETGSAVELSRCLRSCRGLANRVSLVPQCSMSLFFNKIK